MTIILSGLATRVWMKCAIMEVEFKIEIFLRFPLKLSYFYQVLLGTGAENHSERRGMAQKSKRSKKANAKVRKFDNRWITRRLYLLFSIVCTLFLILIARLGYMQITHQGFYTQKLAKATKKHLTRGSLRGQIYDASGQPLVENVDKKVLSFTRSNKFTAEEMRQTAQLLLNYVSVSNPQVSKRQEIDFYLANSEVYKEVVDKLPKEERIDTDGNPLPEATIYQHAVDSIETEKLGYTEEEKKAIYLFSQMNAVENFASATIVTDPMSDEQVTTVKDHLKEFPGFEVITSWDRKVVDSPLASIVGSVSTEQAGLPAEEVDDYLEKGYALNDRVGTSYLEKQYESVLQGERVEKEIHLDKNGNVEKIETLSKGSKGNNIKLSIDLDFQRGVEDILKKSFQAELAAGNATYSEGVYAVALDPKTGKILAMAGMKHEAGSQDLTPDALGTVTNVFVPGSVVKAATLTAGWENGVISGNQVLLDQPISFSGSAPITSWFTQFGSQEINAVQALEYSSNTYMVQIALNLMGQPYQPNMSLKTDQLDPAMNKLRSTFASYGLGTETGIDLPNESTGYVPKEFTIGNYLTDAFGQFDNYTPMQLAQYVATIANDGKRVAPHLVQGIYENDAKGGLGPLKEEIATKELNQVALTPENLAIIKQGFYQVVYGTSGLTTGKTIGEGAAVPISAKTGTAETFVNGGTPAVNTNVIAYAPSENPQIAVAVVFPHNTNLQATVSHSITREIINLYQQKHPMN